MIHLLTIEVPESIYQPIAEKAKAEGRKVEEIALERLADGGAKSFDDPFEELIGSFNSGGMDWANRHDEYLGENLSRELRGESE